MGLNGMLSASDLYNWMGELSTNKTYTSDGLVTTKCFVCPSIDPSEIGQGYKEGQTRRNTLK